MVLAPPQRALIGQWSVKSDDASGFVRLFSQSQERITVTPLSQCDVFIIIQQLRNEATCDTVIGTCLTCRADLFIFFIENI